MHNLDELKEKLHQAKQQVQIGAVYVHYKAPHQLYKLLSVVLNEETEEPYVVYQALYGDNLIWTRSVSVWSEFLEYKGKSTPRFIKQDI